MQIKKYQYELYFLIILVAIVALFFLFLKIERGVWWDEAVYLVLGKNLATGSGYTFNLGTDEIYRPPLLPALVAISYKLGFRPELLISLSSVSTLVLVYMFVQRIFSKRESIIAVSFLGFSPIFWIFSIKVLTEALYMLLFTIAIIVFYYSIRKDQKYFIALGIFTGLLVLSRYPGALILFLFLAVMIYTRVNVLREKYFWLGIIFFITVLSPWLYLSYTTYHSIFGSALFSLRIVNTQADADPWYYHILSIPQVFGLFTVFLIAGTVYSLKKKDFNGVFLLLWAFLPVLIMSFISHKEFRFLISSLPAFSIISSRVFRAFSTRTTIALIVLIFLISSAHVFYVYGYAKADGDGTMAIKNAGLYLKQNAPNDSLIMTSMIPQIRLYSQRYVVGIPRDEERVLEVIEDYKVCYVAVTGVEPEQPGYALNYFENSQTFYKEKEFSSGNTLVQIYRYKLC